METTALLTISETCFPIPRNSSLAYFTPLRQVYFCESIHPPLRTGFSNRKLSAVKQGGDLKMYNAIPTCPFLARYTSSRAKGNQAGMWVCDTVCVWADVCIKTNKKSIKGNIPALLQKHEEASIERGRQWLQCLTTELLSGHKGPLVPPLHPWGSALNGHLCVGKSMGIWAKWGKIP